MSNRIDTKTGKSIPADSHFFNTATGEKLSSEYVIEPPNVKPVVYQPKLESIFKNLFNKKPIEMKPVDVGVSSESQKKVNPNMVSILALVITFGSIGFIGLYLYINFIKTPVIYGTIPVTSNQENKSTSVDLSLTYASSSFNNTQLISVVPDDAFFYAEVNDLNAFLIQHVKAGTFDAAQITKAQNLLKPNFSIFGTTINDDIVWNFVFLPKDIGVVTEAITTFNHPVWKPYIVSDVLVITNNPNVINTLSNVKRNITQNLAQNSEFNRANSHLEKTGQAAIYFVKQDASRSLFSTVLTKDLHEDLLDNIKQVLDTRLYELVITRGVL